MFDWSFSLNVYILVKKWNRDVETPEKTHVLCWFSSELGRVIMDYHDTIEVSCC